MTSIYSIKGAERADIWFGNEETSVIAVSSWSSSHDDSSSSKDHTLQRPVGFAADGIVYEHWVLHHRDTDSPSFLISIFKSVDQKPMIRERVSTQGIIRPHKREEDLPAFKLSGDPQLIGVTPVTVLERYMAAKQAVASTINNIENARMRNIECAS